MNKQIKKSPKVTKNKKKDCKCSIFLILAIVFCISTIVFVFLFVTNKKHYATTYKNETFTGEQQVAYEDAVKNLCEQFLFNKYELALATLTGEQKEAYKDALVELNGKYYELLDYGVTEDNNFYIKFLNFAPKEFINFPTDKISTVYFWKDTERGTYSYAYGYEEIK